MVARAVATTLALPDCSLTAGKGAGTAALPFPPHLVNVGRLIDPPDLAQRVTDLTDRCPGAQRLPKRVQHVAAARCYLPHSIQTPVDLAGIPAATQRRQPLGLLLLD